MTPKPTLQDIVFDPISHEYRIGDHLVPGVTSVIESVFQLYKNPIDKDVLERARLYGQNVHLMLELFDLGTLDEESLDPQLIPVLDQYKKFLKEFRVKEFIAIEKRVYSRQFEYAGTLDRVCTQKNTRGKRMLIDIKTSTTTSPTAGLQTAAYAHAYGEQTGVKITHRFALSINAAGYKMIPFEDYTDFGVFRSCLNIFNWKLRKNL